jgi:hypothetical protein
MPRSELRGALFDFKKVEFTSWQKITTKDA